MFFHPWFLKSKANIPFLISFQIEMLINIDKSLKNLTSHAKLDSGQVTTFGSHTYVSECKIYCIGNKNNLLCVHGYTCVVMLIIYKL